MLRYFGKLYTIYRQICFSWRLQHYYWKENLLLVLRLYYFLSSVWSNCFGYNKYTCLGSLCSIGLKFVVGDSEFVVFPMYGATEGISVFHLMVQREWASSLWLLGHKTHRKALSLRSSDAIGDSPSLYIHACAYELHSYQFYQSQSPDRSSAMRRV